MSKQPENPEKIQPFLAGPFKREEVHVFMKDLAAKFGLELPDAETLHERGRQHLLEVEVDDLAHKIHAYVKHVEKSDSHVILSALFSASANLAARQMVPKPGSTQEMADDEMVREFRKFLVVARENAKESGSFAAECVRRRAKGIPIPEWMNDALDSLPPDVKAAADRYAASLADKPASTPTHTKD